MTLTWNYQPIVALPARWGPQQTTLGSWQRQDTGSGILWSVHRWTTYKNLKKKRAVHLTPFLLRQGEPGTSHYKYIGDTSAVEISNSSEDNSLQNAADLAATWSSNMNMQLNVKKTKELVVDLNIPKLDLPPITINGETIERVITAKLLGIHLSNDLKWHVHVTEIVKSAAKKLYLISQITHGCVPLADILKIFTTVIRPKLEYACPVWHTSLTGEDNNLIESIQKRALKILYPKVSYD